MFPLSDSIQTYRFPFLNILFIAFTVFVFIRQLTTPDPEAFIYTFSLVPAQVNIANPSSLIPFISAMFLHGGFLHIISNMWFLWIFGDNVEGYVGRLFYPLVYFLSGIVGNVAQYLLMPHSPIPMLGASGAVAGILGAYFVLFPHARIKTLIPIFGFVTFAEISAPFMLGYWFVLQIIAGVISLPFSQEGGIAFFAHIGGFVTGAAFAKLVK